MAKPAAKTDMNEWINARLVLPGALSSVGLFLSRDRAALGSVLAHAEQPHEPLPEARPHLERISR